MSGFPRETTEYRRKNADIRSSGRKSRNGKTAVKGIGSKRPHPETEVLSRLRFPRSDFGLHTAGFPRRTSPRRAFPADGKPTVLLSRFPPFAHRPAPAPRHDGTHGPDAGKSPSRIQSALRPRAQNPPAARYPDTAPPDGPRLGRGHPTGKHPAVPKIRFRTRQPKTRRWPSSYEDGHLSSVLSASGAQDRYPIRRPDASRQPLPRSGAKVRYLSSLIRIFLNFTTEPCPRNPICPFSFLSPG